MMLTDQFIHEGSQGFFRGGGDTVFLTQGAQENTVTSQRVLAVVQALSGVGTPVTFIVTHILSSPSTLIPPNSSIRSLFAVADSSAW